MTLIYFQEKQSWRILVTNFLLTSSMKISKELSQYKKSIQISKLAIGLACFGTFIYLFLLGSKTLGTNVLELQFVLCWQTMIKT